MSADDAFAVPGEQWDRVSPRLATLRRSVTLGLAGVLVVGAVALAVLFPDRRFAAVAFAVAVVLVAGWVMFLVGRQVAAWGWVERVDDLVVTRGVLWRRLDVVPYARMQLVDVTSGPLERAFGVATVRMHTAAPGTQAHLPGLPPEQARLLRDRWTERGESLAAGL